MRAHLAGRADSVTELIYEPGRTSIAFLGAGQSCEVGQCSSDEVTELLAGAVSAPHPPIVGREQAFVLQRERPDRGLFPVFEAIMSSVWIRARLV